MTLQALPLPKTLPRDSELVRRICQDGFLEFCIAVSPKKDFVATAFHIILCNQLQRIYEAVRDGKDTRDIFEVQPQIGKSTVVSEMFAAWVLGKQPWPVICASYGASLAEQKSSNCRDIVNSEAYAMIFPKTRLHPESAAKDFWKTTTGGSYRAVGVGGGLTGMSGKLLICDDPFKDRAEADSETVRVATHKWWETVFMSRKQGISGIILVNTRWHLDDVSGHLRLKQKQNESKGLSKKHYDQWNLHSFPAFATEDEYIDGKLFRRTGAVLCPERFSFDAMTKTKNDTEIYEWAALYMQTPILKEDAKFKAEWFRYYEPSEIKFMLLDYYTTVDLASSKAKGADSVVVLTIGVDRSTGYWFIMDYISGHLDPDETINAIFFHVKQYHGTKVWIEAVGYQATLAFNVEKKQRQERTFFEVNDLKQGKKSKEDKIEGLIPLYKNGQIFHRHSDRNSILETELLAFPQGAHDDHPDALAMQKDVVRQAPVIETKEEKKAREKEEREDFDPHKPFSRI